VKIFAKVFVEDHELANAEGREKKGNGQAGRVNGEEQDATRNGVTGGSESENGGENRADAGRPTEGKREAQEESAPDAGLRGFGAEVHIAIEPAGQCWTEKTNNRKREKVSSAEPGEERGMAQQGSDPQCHEDYAEDDSHPEIEFDECTDEMKAEEKDQSSSDGSENSAVLEQERADRAGGSPERNKNDGKAGDKRESRREQTGGRDIALSQLLHADAGQHGNIAGNKRQNTGREK